MDQALWNRLQTVEIKKKNRLPKLPTIATAGTIHQSGTVLAAFQPPGTRGIGQSRPSVLEQVGSVDFRQ
jgi:hypothetical protein